MRRIKAFTLIELLISMIISALIIGMAYTALQRAEETFRKVLSRYHRTNDMLALQMLLNLDCNGARLVTFMDNSLFVDCLDHKKVHYWLLGDKVVRQYVSVKDTFRIGNFVTDVAFMFNKPPCVEKLELITDETGEISQSIVIQMFYTNQVKFDLTESQHYESQLYGR